MFSWHPSHGSRKCCANDKEQEGLHMSVVTCAWRKACGLVINTRCISFHGSASFSVFMVQEQPEIIHADRYVSFLHQCADDKLLQDGQLSHVCILQDSLECHVLVTNVLLKMYSSCRAVEDAFSLFSRMHYRDGFAWTYLIRACTHSEQVALHCFQQMQIEGMIPAKFSCIAALSACSFLLSGIYFHLHILSIGLDGDVFVATALLTMYSMCGSIENARIVFDSISQRDIVTWNAMLTAYVDAKQDKDALLIFQEMQNANVAATSVTFLKTLEACANLTDLETGNAVHKCILARQMQSDVFVGNALINMYCKCNDIEVARTIFGGMPKQDTVSWNTLIAAYARYEQVNEALALFDMMLKSIVRIDEISCIIILSICASMSDLLLGRVVHAMMECSKFVPHSTLCTALISMYGKCASLDDAQLIFDRMQQRDTVAWNALIAAYSQSSFYSSAFILYDKMRADHFVPDKVTFVMLLYACGCLEDVELGQRIHKHIQDCKIEEDATLGTALIQMYGKLGLVDYAEKIFSSIEHKDTTVWNVMIGLYTEVGVEDCAFALFDQMLMTAVLPDKVSCANIIGACAGNANFRLGKQMHARCVVENLEIDMIVGTATVKMYGRCGSFDTACQIFEGLNARDLIAWSSMISLHADREQAKDAFFVLCQMQQQGVIPDMMIYKEVMSACACWEVLKIGKQIHACVANEITHSDIVAGNVLVGMYGKCDSMDDAWVYFEQMSQWDNVTFINILSSCACQCALSKGHYVHDSLLVTDLEGDSDVANALINMYGKCGCLEEAFTVFNLVSEHDLVSWNTIITALSQYGNTEDAIHLFNEMLQIPIRPDNCTFASAISACSHTGLTEVGCGLIVAMQEDHNVSPIVDHYNCIIDMLARAGQLDEAEHLIDRMPAKPTAVTWTALLGACRCEVDVKRGEHAGLSALKLASNESGPYILLSNMYLFMDKSCGTY